MTTTDHDATTGLGPDDRYLIISSDCHGGGQMHEYRDYLPSKWHDEFDQWATTFVNPYEDLEGDEAGRNWDSSRRLRELEDEGVVGEVVFPNTIPPFFEKGSLVGHSTGSHDEIERRWEGLKAHNRWLVDFCNDTPRRRAGIAQISLHDPKAAAEEIRWAAGAGLRGGVLLPGVPPDSGLPPLYAPDYEPIWTACEETGLPVNHHSGSAAPEYGEYLESNIMFLLEVTWFAHRALWHLIFGGVLERHPGMKVVFTEQGTSWIPERLGVLDYYYSRFSNTSTGSQESVWGAEVVDRLSLKPSEYWARQCYVGSSFMRPDEVPLRSAVGIDHIMWGVDYPHREGTQPFTTEALRAAYAGVPPDEVAQMVGTNAARIYGFDTEALRPVADRVGPRVADIAIPLTTIPEGAAKCPAFAGMATAQSL